MVVGTKRRIYVKPHTTCFRIESNSCVLVASNEDLGYEDLFSTSVNEVNDETFKILF